jgi:nonsense-mediated mRNA decay protein 3
MSQLQCPKCGKPSRGVCAECFIRDHPIAVRQETFRDCGCGLGFFKGKWYEDRQELLMDLAKRTMVSPSGVNLRIIDVAAEPKAGRLQMLAHVQGSYSGSTFKTDVKWDIKPEQVKCDTCVKLGTGYYEAILQLRDGIELDLDEKQISSIEHTRGGWDYYMINMGYAQAKVVDLINKGFLVKQSSKLYGKKNGRDIFRFYYSIKRPHFSKGDFLEYEGKMLRVREVAKAVKLNDVTNGHPVGASMHKLEDAKVIAKSADARKATITEVRPDGMQILDEGGCDIFDVAVKADARQGDEVEYIRLKGKSYVL